MNSRRHLGNRVGQRLGTGLNLLVQPHDVSPPARGLLGNVHQQQLSHRLRHIVKSAQVVHALHQVLVQRAVKDAFGKAVNGHGHRHPATQIKNHIAGLGGRTLVRPQLIQPPGGSQQLPLGHAAFGRVTPGACTHLQVLSYRLRPALHGLIRGLEGGQARQFGGSGITHCDCSSWVVPAITTLVIRAADSITTSCSRWRPAGRRTGVMLVSVAVWRSWSSPYQRTMAGVAAD